MNHSEALDQIATALAAFQAEAPSVAKTHKAKISTKSGKDYEYDYADLADTVEAAKPLLKPNGLSVTQWPGWENGDDVLTTVMLHTSGQWMSGTMRLFLSAEEPRGHGSAITYARRYAYCAALGIVADKDDDGAAASGQAPPGQAQRRAPPQVTEMTPKRRLLQACAGDKDLAERLWKEAFDGKSDDGLSGTEIDLLLSRAKAEVERAT